MKKRLAMTVMTTMILTAALAGCGTDNSSAKAAGQLTTEIVATAELPELQTDEAAMAEEPVSGTLIAEEPQQDPSEAEAPVDTKAADLPVVSRNSTSTNANTSATAPTNTHSHHHIEPSNPGTASNVNTGSTTSAPAASTPAPDTTAPAPQHTHSWVHHDATGHYEIQTVKAAWDEAVYATRAKDICNQCGAELTAENIDQHFKDSGYSCGGYHTEWERTLTGYVHHDAETTQVWVEYSPAYNECSCGARQ